MGEVGSYELILSEITETFKREFKKSFYMYMEVLFKLVEGMKKLQFIIGIMNHGSQIPCQDLCKIFPILPMSKERSHELLQTHIGTNPCIYQHMPEENINS